MHACRGGNPTLENAEVASIVRRANALVSTQQAAFRTSNRFPVPQAKVGAALLNVLAAERIKFLAADSGCSRSIYMSVGSGNRVGTQQGPTLLYELQQADFKWGRVHEAFTP